MKRFLAPILLMVFLFPSLALGQAVTMDDLVITNGLYYKKFTNVPFTGEVTGRIQGTFKDGNQDGLWVGYHENGQLEFKGTFKDGKREGPWVFYYDNGQLSLEGTYKDGKADGPWISFNEDGTVDEGWTGTWKDGVKVE
jgi:antitoxin component YwqK of YwqJK toxin-antitoxin module